MSAFADTLDLLLADPRQLYDTMDPAPFRSRDLDPQAEAYIVAWARETRRDQPLALRIALERDDGTGAMLGDAVRAHFAHPRGWSAAASRSCSAPDASRSRSVSPR